MSGAAAAVAAPMRALGDVMGRVHGKHPAQMPLPEDQHSLGELGPHRQHEAFGEAVRSSTPRGDLEYFDPRVRHDRVERRRELTGPIADKEPKPGSTLTEV